MQACPFYFILTHFILTRTRVGFVFSIYLSIFLYVRHYIYGSYKHVRHNICTKRSLYNCNDMSIYIYVLLYFCIYIAYLLYLSHRSQSCLYLYYMQYSIFVVNIFKVIQMSIFVLHKYCDKYRHALKVSTQCIRVNISTSSAHQHVRFRQLQAIQT